MSDVSAVTVRLTVNGREAELRVHPMSRLLDVLRTELHLTGTKEGCGEGECGACSVLVNGELVNSCLTPVLQADGADVTTIEGIAGGPDVLHAVQQAFITHGGAQCTYNHKRRSLQCTSLNHAEYDLRGTLLHGRTHGNLRAYEVRRDGSVLQIRLEA